MKRLTYSKSLALAGVLLFAAATAIGDDVFPPEWRGQPGSQWWIWGYWNGFPGPMLPEVGEQYPPPGVPPVANRYAMAVVAGTATLWEEWGGRQRVIEVTAHDDLVFYLDNYSSGLPDKRVRLQITYPGANASPSGFNVTTDLGGPDLIPAIPVATQYHPGNWITVAYDFVIQPNPQWEQIGLKFNHYPEYVDQVVIDTWCMPEPGTMVLLVLGGLALLRRRSKMPKVRGLRSTTG